MYNFVVKVGNNSDIRFNSERVKCKRVITIDEMINAVNDNTDCLIIENIDESEYKNALEFINEYKKEHTDNILFYINDNDETTCGLADELNCIASTTLESIYTRFKNQYNEYLGCRFNLNNNQENKSDDDIFEEAFEKLDDKDKNSEAEIEVWAESLDNDNINEISINEENKDEYTEKEEEVAEDNDYTAEDNEYTAEDNEYTAEDNDSCIIEEYNEPEEIENSNNNNINETTNEYTEAQDENIIELRKICDALKNQNDIYKNIIENIYNSEAIEVNAVAKEEKELIESKLKKAEDFNNSLSNEINLYKNCILGIKNKLYIDGYDSLSDFVDKLYQKIDSNDNNIKELTNEIDRLKKEIANNAEEYLEIVNSLKANIAEYESEINNLKESLDSTEKEHVEAVNNLKANVAEYESEISKLKEISNNSEKENILIENTNLKNMVNKNSYVIDTLKSQVGTLTDELNKLNKDKIESNIYADGLIEENRRIKEQLNGMYNESVSYGGINCIYSEKAFIIPVFGCGSYGVTTTAMSIANELSVNNSVIYVDMDICNPKADTWFNQSPIAVELNEKTKLTGLGVFFSKPFNFFVDNKNKVIKSISKLNTGKLDYLSGIYNNVDSATIMQADFQALFRFLGDSYNYIIVDMGKIGYSNVQDQLIRMICNISYKSVVVSLNNRFDIRNTKIKISNSKVSEKNMLWLINMSNDKKIDDPKSITKSLKVSVMMYDDDVRCSSKNFLNSSKITKAIFKDFMTKFN